MAYDFATGKMKAIVYLTQSGDLNDTGIKFRVNDSWGINLGDDGGDGGHRAR